jgi:protein-L-isoaspartate(D-aspartate) O-methyltransferase
MSNFAAQRLNMVEGQVRANDVTDIRIQSAMADIPRERFVAERLNSVAYADSCLEVAPGRHILDPRCLAKLLQLAAIKNSDHVLDVGCASGYSAAILGRLAHDVIAFEENQDLARIAAEQLHEMENVRLVEGALSGGHPQGAPYDVIFVNGALETNPDMLLGQLAQAGRLVAVIRAAGRGRAHLYVKNEGMVSSRAAFDAQVPVLPGFERVEGFVF